MKESKSVGMKKYSIIIPVYNSEKTLKRCLDSLLCQRRSDIEIIAVNDGSPDHSNVILRDYQQNYDSITVINKKNGGVSSARNAGLDHAAGEYILFVDGDDAVTEDYFSVLDSFSNDDLCVFGRQNIGSSVSDAEYFSAYKSERDFPSLLRKMIAGRKMLPPWNKRYKRSIIEEFQIRFVDEFVIGEDFDFCMNYALRCGSMSVYDQAIYLLDVSGMDSLSRKYRENLDRKLKAVYLHIEELIKNSSNPLLDRKELFSVVDFLYARNVMSCIKEEMKKERLGYFSNRERYSSICNSFSNAIGNTSAHINKLHHILRTLIKMRLSFVLYMITRIMTRK